MMLVAVPITFEFFLFAEPTIRLLYGTTYAEAASGTSSLWTLKPTSASTAIINKDLAVGPTATPTFTVNSTTGIVNAAAVITTGNVISTGGVKPGTHDQSGDFACHRWTCASAISRLRAGWASPEPPSRSAFAASSATA